MSALTILVATDFSDFSDRATAQALRLARHASAKLVLAHVLGPTLRTERDARNPDFVVVGTLGRGWLHRTLFGSISRRIYEESPMPVMLVR